MSTLEQLKDRVKKLLWTVSPKTEELVLDLITETYSTAKREALGEVLNLVNTYSFQFHEDTGEEVVYSNDIISHLEAELTSEITDGK